MFPPPVAASAADLTSSLLRAFDISEDAVAKCKREVIDPSSLVLMSEADIRQLLPEREDEQTKLQILVMELKAERRHGESEELTSERLLERSEAPNAKPVETHTDATPAAARSVAADAKPSSVIAPSVETASARPSPTEDLSAFLTGLGLAHLEPLFDEQDLELSMMQSLSSEDLVRDLTDLGLSIGQRRKVIKGIEQRASAAKKEAALKTAEDQVIAATVQKEHDEQQLKAQREEIEKLRRVIEERGKPDEVVCPLTLDVMLNPVVAADGHTYERAHIEAWLRTHVRSPLTNAVLEHKNLIPNEIARRMVQKFIEECRKSGRNPDA